MTGTRIRSDVRRILAAYAAMALCFGTAGHAESSDSESGSHSEFSDFSVPNRDAEPVPGAVDITLIDPPIEVETSPAAKALGSGIASYYGRRFHGRPTASGERFDMHALTAAHRTLPFGSLVEVTNPRNGRSVIVRVNDRGPFVRGRTIDVSRAAAEQLGMISRGHARVELVLLED